MKLTLIIPAYNELKTLPTLLERLVSLELDLELIVVDDGSNDGTKEFLEAQHHKKMSFLVNPENRGKGWSIRRAIPLSKGEIIGIQDADLEYDPDDLYRLMAPFERGAQVVFGSRILNSRNTMSYWRYYLGGRFLTLVTNLLNGSKITDEPSGYKLFRRTVITGLNLTCSGFDFCPEVTGKLLRRGIRIEEVPISYNPRSFSEGKKIHWRDGLRAVAVLIRERFLCYDEKGDLYE
jgi:dolichol-phosphate mannosyltransferase